MMTLFGAMKVKPGKLFPNSSHMDISVIIPSYNGKKLLEKSVPAVFDALKLIPSSELLLVDNNSSDNTDAYIKYAYPSIQFIQLSQNTGYTGAVNAGIRQASGRFILVLNNDCILNTDTIHTMYQFLLSHSQYVVTQPVILKPDKTIEQIGYWVDLSRAKAYPVTDKSEIANVKEKKLFSNLKWYGLSGTCLLMYRQVCLDIGLFDESFHSYLEDVDFCMRLAKKGNQYAPTLSAYCIHSHMATSKTMGYYKHYHDLTNWIRIIKKNYPFWYIQKHIFSLALERMKNLNGLLKKMVQLMLKHEVREK